MLKSIETAHVSAAAAARTFQPLLLSASSIASASAFSRTNLSVSFSRTKG
jgi:hypothetical protein